MGGQLVRSVDSIAANITEGFGRFHYGESRHFSYYSRGSLFETKTWIAKAKARKLIDEDEFTNLVSDMGNIGCQTQ
ncbi:MAG: four helix bundle protein [Bacteroidetes bacterium]|nr:MAG: four helix bundle protein [Bacteroidota bacterium]